MISYSDIDLHVVKDTLIISFWITIISLIIEFGLYLWFPVLYIMIPLFIVGVVYPIILMREIIESLIGKSKK